MTDVGGPSMSDVIFSLFKGHGPKASWSRAMATFVILAGIGVGCYYKHGEIAWEGIATVVGAIWLPSKLAEGMASRNGTPPA